jgi:hypothetical protein
MMPTKSPASLYAAQDRTPPDRPQLKHYEHIYCNNKEQTDATLGWNSWNTMNILLQQQKNNSWNIRLKQLKHHERIIATTLIKLLQQIGLSSWNTMNIYIATTKRENNCNMGMKKLKHREHIIATTKNNS